MRQIENRWPTITVVAAFLVAATTMNPGTRAADACPALLTEQECRAYLSQRERAATPGERAELEGRYASLLKERARLCPSGRDGARQPVGHPESASRAERRVWM